MQGLGEVRDIGSSSCRVDYIVQQRICIVGLVEGLTNDTENEWESRYTYAWSRGSGIDIHWTA